MTKPKFAVIGSGALGGLYGGMLANAGYEVHFLFHSDADHVRKHGLRVDSKRGDFHLAKVHAHGAAESLPPCDVTILGLKATNNGLLDQLLPAPTAAGGSVLVLQNGLDVEADTVRVVGSERVWGGCCFLCSNKVGPGHIKHLDYGRILFARYRPADAAVEPIDPATERLRDALRDAGIDAQATDDLWLARWRKLMWNIPFNGLSVVLDASTKELIEDTAATALAQAIMAEVAAGSAAMGRHQPDDAIAKTIEHTAQMVPYDSSMRLDYRAGRPLEIEAILGNPLRAARDHGVMMPKVEMLYQQLAFLQARAIARRAS